CSRIVHDTFKPCKPVAGPGGVCGRCSDDRQAESGMRRHGVFGPIAAALLAAFVGLPSAEASDDACAPAIVALGDHVLANREAAGRFQARRYGAVAAYLTIRYGHPAPEEAEARLAELLDADVVNGDDLAAAWFISEH